MKIQGVRVEASSCGDAKVLEGGGQPLVAELVPVEERSTVVVEIDAGEMEYGRGVKVRVSVSAICGNTPEARSEALDAVFKEVRAASDRNATEIQAFSNAVFQHGDARRDWYPTREQLAPKPVAPGTFPTPASPSAVITGPNAGQSKTVQDPPVVPTTAVGGVPAYSRKPKVST